MLNEVVSDTKGGIIEVEVWILLDSAVAFKAVVVGIKAVDVIDVVVIISVVEGIIDIAGSVEIEDVAARIYDVVGIDVVIKDVGRKTVVDWSAAVVGRDIVVGIVAVVGVAVVVESIIVNEFVVVAAEPVEVKRPVVVEIILVVEIAV